MTPPGPFLRLLGAVFRNPTIADGAGIQGVAPAVESEGGERDGDDSDDSDDSGHAERWDHERADRTRWARGPLMESSSSSKMTRSPTLRSQNVPDTSLL